MYQQYSSTRQILINDGRVTDIVNPSNIKIGYEFILDDYPCITIFRGGGGGTGRLGYKTSPAGSKDVNLNGVFQIDLFHKDSVEDIEELDDAVRKAMMSGVAAGVGCDMTSNPSTWDESFQSYRITQTWVLREVISD
jgi:hypothetical protein